MDPTPYHALPDTISYSPVPAHLPMLFISLHVSLTENPI